MFGPLVEFKRIEGDGSKLLTVKKMQCRDAPLVRIFLAYLNFSCPGSKIRISSIRTLAFHALPVRAPI